MILRNVQPGESETPPFWKEDTLNTSKLPRTYTVPETAEILGISARSLYRYIQNGDADDLGPVKVIKKGRSRVGFLKSRVDALTGFGGAA